MATTAGDPVFVDTNVLVYANTATAPWHLEAQAALQSFRASAAELRISRQILREYLATLSRTQSFSSPVPALTLIADIIRFQSQFRIAEDGPAVTSSLLALLKSIPIGGKQVHDANIVATMQTHGLRRLSTHNTADFARFGHLIQIEPLVPTP
jgi:predicted nucleic acid-binding protein